MESRMKYLLDMSQLQQGDIVLEDGETKFISSAIKKITKSKYSHAMIYVGGTLIHAVAKGGVFSKNPQRILRSSESSFKVLRLKDTLLELNLALVCDNARAKVGSIYSIAEAGKAILPNNDKTTKKQFCSRLVAQSYNEAGVKIVDDPYFCTPEDINQSPLLEEVKSCVRQATQADLDMAAKIDPNLENQEETLKWLRLARKQLKSEGIEVQTINDVAEHLSKDNTWDKRICKHIESTKYLQLYNVDRKLNTYRYCEKEFSAKVESEVNMSDFFNFEFNLNRGEIERHGKNLMIAQNNYRNSKLKYCKLHVKLYRNILKENECRLKIIRNYKALEPSIGVAVNEYLNRVSSLLK